MPGIGFHVACSSVPNGGDWRRLLSCRLPSTIAGHPLFVTVNRLHSTIKKTASAVSAKPELAPLPSDISGEFWFRVLTNVTHIVGMKITHFLSKSLPCLKFGVRICGQNWTVLAKSDQLFSYVLLSYIEVGLQACIKLKRKSGCAWIAGVKAHSFGKI